MNDDLCEAIKEAGIASPESEAGIQFCLNCPYPRGCVVLEDTPERRIERTTKLQRVRLLYNEGNNRREIANILGVSEKTVGRYLRRLR